MAEHADQTRADSQLPGLLLPGLVPPLLGILAFALLRESYAWFYGRYGVVPEDVGISQIRMLIPGRPAASFLIVLIGIWAYFVVGRGLLRRLRARSPRAEGLVNTRLVYLGHANGVMVLYDPPMWGQL